MGNLFGDKNNTTTSQTTYPPYVQNALQSTFGKAQSAANTPYQPYQGPQVAPFSGLQNTAFNGLVGAANSANPYIDQATGLVAAGTQPVAPTPFSTGAVGQYENPYTSDVIDATQNQFNLQNAQQQTALTGNAASQHALGGDRSAVAAAQLAGQQQTAQAPVIAGLRNQNYQQALNEFNTQQQTGLAAAQANNYTNLYGAGELGNLGQLAQGTGLAGAGALLQAGGLQQQQQQANLNVPYNNYLTAQQYPFYTSNFLSSALSGNAGLQPTRSTTTPGPSTASTIAGLGTTFAGLGGFSSNANLPLGGVFFNRGGALRKHSSGGGLRAFADGGTWGAPTPSTLGNFNTGPINWTNYFHKAQGSPLANFQMPYAPPTLSTPPPSSPYITSSGNSSTGGGGSPGAAFGDTGNGVDASNGFVSASGNAQFADLPSYGGGSSNSSSSSGGGSGGFINNNYASFGGPGYGTGANDYSPGGLGSANAASGYDQSQYDWPTLNNLWNTLNPFSSSSSGDSTYSAGNPSSSQLEPMYNPDPTNGQLAQAGLNAASYIPGIGDVASLANFIQGGISGFNSQTSDPTPSSPTPSLLGSDKLGSMVYDNNGIAGSVGSTIGSGLGWVSNQLGLTSAPDPTPPYNANSGSLNDLTGTSTATTAPADPNQLEPMNTPVSEPTPVSKPIPAALSSVDPNDPWQGWNPNVYYSLTGSHTPPGSLASLGFSNEAGSGGGGGSAGVGDGSYNIQMPDTSYFGPQDNSGYAQGNPGYQNTLASNPNYDAWLSSQPIGQSNSMGFGPGFGAVDRGIDPHDTNARGGGIRAFADGGDLSDEDLTADDSYLMQDDPDDTALTDGTSTLAQMGGLTAPPHPVPSNYSGGEGAKLDAEGNPVGSYGLAAAATKAPARASSGNYGLDPAHQGLIAAGLGMLSTPGNFGTAIGKGGLIGLSAYDKAVQEERQMKALENTQAYRSALTGIQLKKAEDLAQYHSNHDKMPKIISTGKNLQLYNPSDKSVHDLVGQDGKPVANEVVRNRGRAEDIAQQNADNGSRSAYQWQSGTQNGVSGVFRLPTKGGEQPTFIPGSALTGRGGAGAAGATSQLAAQLVKEGAAKDTAGALAIIHDPTGAHKNQVNAALERIASSTAQKDPDFADDPAGVVDKWRKHYGLGTIGTPVPSVGDHPPAPAPQAPPLRPAGVPAGAGYSPSKKSWWWKDAAGKWQTQ